MQKMKPGSRPKQVMEDYSNDQKHYRFVCRTVLFKTGLRSAFALDLQDYVLTTLSASIK